MLETIGLDVRFRGVLLCAKNKISPHYLARARHAVRNRLHCVACARMDMCMRGARTAKRTVRTCAIARHTHQSMCSTPSGASRPASAVPWVRRSLGVHTPSLDVCCGRSVYLGWFVVYWLAVLRSSRSASPGRELFVRCTF